MIDTMQHPMTPIIAAKFAILKPLLDEQARRLWAAVEARALGRGGISQVAEATGLSRATVRAGLQELAPPATATGLQTPPGRLRRPGGGRQPLGTRDPHLVQALETLVDPVTRGDRCRCSDGLARARPTWRLHSRRKGIRSVSGRSIDSSMIWATVSNPTARRSRAATIRTGMRNFSTLIGGLRPSSNGGNLSYRLIPRRKNS